MTTELPWLIVAEVDGRIVAFCGICDEDGETLEELLADPIDVFGSIETYTRSRLGCGPLRWRYGTLDGAGSSSRQHRAPRLRLRLRPRGAQAAA
jgi:hypothetical protein